MEGSYSTSSLIRSSIDRLLSNVVRSRSECASGAYLGDHESRYWNTSAPPALPETKKNSRNRPFFSNIFILFPPNSIQQFRWSVIFLCVCVCVCYCSSRKIPERGKRRKELTKGPDQKKIWNLKKTDQKTKQRSCRCLMRPYMARPYSLNERTRVLIGWPFWAAWYITHERGLSTVSRCLPNLRKKKKSGNKKRVREETWRRQTWVKKKRSQLVSR